MGPLSTAEPDVTVSPRAEICYAQQEETQVRGEQEAEMGGSLGQRDRQTPRETLRFQKWGHRAAHSLSARDGWGSGRNWGLGRRRAPVRALPPALGVALSILKSKMRKQDGSRTL